MGRQLGLSLCPLMKLRCRSHEGFDRLRVLVHCLEELIFLSLSLMFRSVLEDLRLMLDPQGSNAEVTRQTFDTAMRTWAEKVKNNNEMLW
jgi:hypothetical protein